MDLSLAPVVWKLLVGEEVTMEDYGAIDSIGASFLDKLRSEEDLEQFQAEYSWMDFTVPSLGAHVSVAVGDA